MTTTRRIELPNGNVEYRNEFGELHSPEGHSRVDSAGHPEYRINGLLHSQGDKPAKIGSVPFVGPSALYYKNGKLHRDGDKPAIIGKEGTRKWYREGNLHREGDKPAIITSFGARTWYKNGVPHRDGGKPFFEADNGTKKWYNKYGFITERDPSTNEDDEYWD